MPSYASSTASSVKSDKEASRSTTEPRDVCVAVVTRPRSEVCVGDDVVHSSASLNATPPQTEILLISTRKSKGNDNWLLPKGGWEGPGETFAQAAVRETLEEAGVQTVFKKDKHDKSFHIVDDDRPLKDLPEGARFIPKIRYRCFELIYEKEDNDNWQEADERSRQWVTWSRGGFV